MRWLDDLGDTVATSAVLRLSRTADGWALQRLAPPGRRGRVHRVRSAGALEGFVRARYGPASWHQLLDACFDPALFPAWLQSLDERGLPRPPAEHRGWATLG